MELNIHNLQTHIGTNSDGDWGKTSRAMLVRYFINLQAPAVTAAEIEMFANRLGGTPAQINAIAKTESSGAGFDKLGRPKILFERHKFYALTKGKFPLATWNNPRSGGYDDDSWTKLCFAVRQDIEAAFGSASWGKFQVMGYHAEKLGFANSFELAEHCIDSEANHYDLLVRYIENFGLINAFRKISKNPEDCRDFAELYNGPKYEKYDYHTKIARNMA